MPVAVDNELRCLDVATNRQPVLQSLRPGWNDVTFGRVCSGMTDVLSDVYNRTSVSEI